MKYELAQAKKKLLEKKGREIKKAEGKKARQKQLNGDLSTIDKTPTIPPPPKPKETTPHNTRAIFINQ